MDVAKSVAEVVTAIGTILGLYGLKIRPNDVETTFIDGKPYKPALIEVRRPRVAKTGAVMVVVGMGLLVGITVIQGLAKCLT